MGRFINREDAGSIPDADRFIAGQQPVDISSQRRYEIDARHMFLLV